MLSPHAKPHYPPTENIYDTIEMKRILNREDKQNKRQTYKPRDKTKTSIRHYHCITGENR